MEIASRVAIAPVAPAYVRMTDPPLSRCPICVGAWRPVGTKRDPLSGMPYRYTRCTSCGFLAVNPRPSPAGLADFYSSGAWTFFGGHVDAREEHIDPAHLVPWAMSFVHSAGRRMLDIGAATGCYAREALRRGWAVTAVEPDRRAAVALRERLGVEAEACLFEDFVPRVRFDLVVCNQVLGHAHDPVRWARGFRSALAPGGVLALGVLHAASFWQRWIGLRDPYAKPPLNLNHFTKRSLRVLLGSAGLRLCAARSYSRFPWGLLSRKLRLPDAMRPPVDWVFRRAQHAPLAVLDTHGLGLFLQTCARRPMDE